jgi:hypothetical protein
MHTDEIVKLTHEVIADVIRRRHGDAEPFPGHERRRSPRWPFPGTVEVHVERSADPVFGTCCNLSETGLGMCAEKFLEVDSIVELAVHVPEVSFYGKGIVRYCSQTPRGYMTGVEFIFDD